jgi:phage-related protein
MEKLPFLIFKEQSSLGLGLLITDKSSYKGAERDITYTSITGRNGDLITDNGRYKNIKITYKSSLLNTMECEFAVMAHKIKGWLLSEPGYFRLWDSYDSKYYRLASYSGEVGVEQELRDLGTLSMTFNCKPFKYSFEGQNTIVFTQSGTLYNAEFFPSAPYIKVVGSGTITLTINDSSFTLQNIDDYIELDFDMPNAYRGLEGLNFKVSGSDMSALRLQPGNNYISWVGNVQQVEITPRWCCL